MDFTIIVVIYLHHGPYLYYGIDCMEADQSYEIAPPSGRVFWGKAGAGREIPRLSFEPSVPIDAIVRFVQENPVVANLAEATQELVESLQYALLLTSNQGGFIVNDGAFIPVGAFQRRDQSGVLAVFQGMDIRPSPAIRAAVVRYFGADVGNAVGGRMEMLGHPTKQILLLERNWLQSLWAVRGGSNRRFSLISIPSFGGKLSWDRSWYLSDAAEIRLTQYVRLITETEIDDLNPRILKMIGFETLARIVLYLSIPPERYISRKG